LLFQEFACNGTVVEHPEYGEVIQMQGDQRQNISNFLKKIGLASAESIKVLVLFLTFCIILLRNCKYKVVNFVEGLTACAILNLFVISGARILNLLLAPSSSIFIQPFVVPFSHIDERGGGDSALYQLRSFGSAACDHGNHI
jgi:hypothetical protein